MVIQMNNLFTPTDYDYMIGRTIREEYLNGEVMITDMDLESLKEVREQIISQLNNNLLWYYLTCDVIKLKEDKEKGLKR